jgi:hypothetical protein
VQIENPDDRVGFRWLNEPDVRACICGCIIQNALCLKIEFAIRSIESGFLKIPSQIKCFHEFRQQVAITFSRAKCSQRNVSVQREFTHVAGGVRQQYGFDESFSARLAGCRLFLSVLSMGRAGGCASMNKSGILDDGKAEKRTDGRLTVF